MNPEKCKASCAAKWPGIVLYQSAPVNNLLVILPRAQNARGIEDENRSIKESGSKSIREKEFKIRRHFHQTYQTAKFLQVLP